MLLQVFSEISSIISGYYKEFCEKYYKSIEEELFYFVEVIKFFAKYFEKYKVFCQVFCQVFC